MGTHTNNQLTNTYTILYIFTMMKSIIALLFTLMASASAFAPLMQQTAARSALSMAAQSPELKKGIIATVAAAVPTVFTSVAAMATDGTNEMFGVDDTRLLGVLFLVHWGILTLYLQ